MTDLRLPSLLRAALQLRAENDLTAYFFHMVSPENDQLLSSITQAVLDAANNTFDQAGTTRQGVAAALRTAASMVTEEFTPGQSTWGEGYYEGACKFNEYLKAIASELEGLN
jgi:acyl-homoserine lactone acylase PvdQ